MIIIERYYDTIESIALTLNVEPLDSRYLGPGWLRIAFWNSQDNYV